MDFDYTTETITPDSTNILTIGGTGGLEVPIGNTAQRPISPSDGTIRYNIDIESLEEFTNGAWAAIVDGFDKRLSTMNVLKVSKDPGIGEFSSIKTAVDSISDASSTKRYIVSVASGVYNEDPITMKPFVCVTGDVALSTVISANNPNAHLITGCNDSVLKSVLVTGATGTGSAAISFEDGVDDVTNKAFSLLFIRFGNNSINIRCNSTGKKTSIIALGLQFGGVYTYSQCLVATSSGTGGQARIQIRASTTIGATAPLPDEFAYASGPGAEIFLNGVQTRISISTPHGIGVRLNNGALFRGLSASFRGYSTGILTENIGVAPTVLGYNTAFESNTEDMTINHPTTSGVFSGVAAAAKITSASTDISFLFADPEVAGTNIVGNLNLGSTISDSTNVTPLIQETSPVGLLSGGSLSVATDTSKVHISAGYGYLQPSTGISLKYVSWVAGDITVPDNAPSTIYVTENGTLSYGATEPDFLKNIILGGVYKLNGVVSHINRSPIRADNDATQIDNFLRIALGPIYVSGSIVTENTTPFKLNITAGEYYFSRLQFNPSGGSAHLFDIYGADGSITLAIDTVPNTQYYNGSTLTNLTTGYYTKHTLYVFGQGSDESYIMIYGQDQYSTLIQAESASLPTPPSFLTSVGVSLASIIVQQGATNITEFYDLRPRLGFQSPSVLSSTTHGNLLGLSADDHKQYLLVDGTRSMSGDLSLGSHNITNAGTVNGITVQSHGSRHGANSADPVATAAPSANLTASTTNSIGIADTLARSDHSHQITGFQPLDATLTSLAAYNTNGILTQTAVDTFTGRTLTGISSRISVVNGNGVSGNPVIDIDAAYVGQSSITTVGTISSGTWNGTPIAIANGGTGQTTASNAINALIPSQTGNNGKVLSTNGTVVSWIAPPTGTVTSVSVVSANGLAGTVATSTSTPAITLSTTITGMLKGNGTAISAAITGTDYSVGTSALATGILKSTTSTGALTIAVASDFPTLNQNTTGTSSNVTGTVAVANGGTGLTSLGSADQLLGVNAAGTATEYKTVTAGTAIGISNAANSITINNTGVTSNVAGTGISVSGATGAVTVTNTGVTSAVAGTNISVSGSTGAVTFNVTGTVASATSATNATNSTNVGIADDTSTNATVYPTWVTANTGNLPEKVSSTKLLFNPSTGLLTSTSFSGSGANLTNIPNSALVNSAITITAGTGISTSGSPVSLGGAVTISNTGVTSAVAGTNISVSGSTGAVTFNVTGTVPSATLATNATNTAITDDTTTNASVYPTWVTANTGNLPEKVSSTKLSFNPSTGLLTSTGFSGSGANLTSIPNSALVNSSITVAAGTGIGVSGSPVSLGSTVTLSNTGVTSVVAGAGISVSGATGAVTVSAINSGTVTSVALSAPSIFTVSGSPVTSNGTLALSLATQAANTFFTGPTSGAASAPTFRTVGINELSDVVITTPATNQVIAYNGTNWINTGAVGANASGTVGVSASGGGTAWTLISGTRYYADFVHNLGTTNVVITLYDTSDNSVVIAQSLVTTNTNTVRVTVTGNTTTLKVVVVANGQSIVAGGSTPSSVITASNGVTVSVAATKLNFTGQAVGVTDAGSGTTNITIGSRFTFFANSLDTPTNSDFAINSISPVTTDPTYASLNVRSFSNTVEQGVACLVSIPSGATTMTVKMRGRAQTAPGSASVVQPRLYYRLLPNNAAVTSWSAAQELTNIAIPTNANFQYSVQAVALSTLSLTAGNLYQFEFTRRVSGVTGTNLAANYLLAELTIEFA